VIMLLAIANLVPRVSHHERPWERGWAIV